MKIAHVIGKMKNAGVESVVFNYLANINDPDFSFDVLYDADSTAEIPEHLKEKGVSFIEIPPYQKFFSYLKTVEELCRKNRYDAVHVHLNSLSFMALYAAWRAGIKKRICHNHTTTSKAEPIKGAVKLMLRPFNPMFATDYVACGNLAAKWMYGEKRLKSGKVTIIDNAIDSNRFSFNEEDRRKIRNKYSIPENSFVIGHVGRYAPVKNHRFLIDVFAKYLEKNENAVLFLLGDGVEELLKTESGSVFNRIIIAGAAGDTSPYYSAMDAFCLPSLYEGLPMAVLEAQASGIYCFVSDRVTTECRVCDNVSFLPINRGADMWVSALCNVGKGDRASSSKSFENGKFDIERASDKLIAYYKSIIR